MWSAAGHTACAQAEFANSYETGRWALSRCLGEWRQRARSAAMPLLTDDPHLREGCGSGDLVPASKSLASESAVISGGEQVASRSEMRGDDSVYLDEALRVPGGLKPPHASFSFACRLVGVLGPVV